MFLLTAYDVNALTAGGHRSVCLFVYVCNLILLSLLLSINSTDKSTEHTHTGYRTSVFTKSSGGKFVCIFHTCLYFSTSQRQICFIVYIVYVIYITLFKRASSSNSEILLTHQCINKNNPRKKTVQ